MREMKFIVVLFAIVVMTGCAETVQNQEGSLFESAQNSETDDNGDLESLDGMTGVVLEFNEQGMKIEIADHEELEDGETIMVTGLDENEVRDIFFNKDTIFEIHEVDIETETVEISHGTVENLHHQANVTIFTVHEEERVVATKVEIWINAN